MTQTLVNVTTDENNKTSVIVKTDAFSKVVPDIANGNDKDVAFFEGLKILIQNYGD